MADDIAPALLLALQEAFEEELQRGGAAALLAKLESGALWPDAQEYAYLVGAALSDALGGNLSSAVLPDGRLYWNIADRVLRPLLERDRTLVSEYAQSVQQQANAAAGIGLKAQAAKSGGDRIEGLLNMASAAAHYDDIAPQLQRAVKLYSQTVADDTLKANVEFLGGAGLKPRLTRRAESKCCAWCSSLAGTYAYPDVPKDVYRRHDNCRCTVEYDPGSGRRQNVHTKQWSEPQEVLEQRKNLAGIDTAARVREVARKADIVENVMPEYLRSATPGVGNITYEEGYKVSQHQAEIRTAQWLHDNLGGDIVLLQENLGGAKKPDYIWREKFWELKNITSAKASDSATRGALKQIAENPGGIIIDCGTDKISIADLQKMISDRVKRSGKFTVDILVLGQSKLLKVLRYKK